MTRTRILLRSLEILVLGLMVLGYFWWGYFGVAAYTLPWKHLSVELAIDRAIPFVPGWALVYVAGYLVILVPPILARDIRLIRAGAASCLILFSLAYLCFLAFPVRLLAPALPRDSLAATILRLATTKTDHGMNCFPSLHVATSFLCALSCCRLNRVVGLAMQALTLLIALSTLLIKRHYLLDVPAGYLLALAVHHGFMERFFERYVRGRASGKLMQLYLQ